MTMRIAWSKKAKPTNSRTGRADSLVGLVFSIYVLDRIMSYVSRKEI